MPGEREIRGAFREQRGELVRRQPVVTALDHVEVERARDDPQRWRLRLTFLTPPPAGLGSEHLRVRTPQGVIDPAVVVEEVGSADAGDRAVTATVRVTDAERAARLARDPTVYTVEVAGLPVDRFFSRAPFRFDGVFPSPPAAAAEPAEEAAVPDVDYLAKDYASFLRLMLDRMAARAPEWSERNPADLGVAVIETLAYTADQLSYYQDAVATEAYLDTARTRRSVRRHLRLVGYHLHQGTNARAWVRIELDPERAGGELELPAGTRLLSRAGGLPATVPHPSRGYDEALAQGSLIFETMESARLRPAYDRMPLYAWGASDYTLPKGAVGIALRGHYAELRAGDALLLEETPEAPAEGAAAPPGRTHVARLRADAACGTDPVTEVEITELELRREDALPFAMRVRRDAERAYAHGNLVLADHGHAIAETLPPVPAEGRYAPTLERRGLVCREPYAPAVARRRPAREALEQRPERAVPDVTLVERGAAGAGSAGVWTARRDLLDSEPFDQHFVVETEGDGAATLRFGDGRLGRRPPPGTEFEAIYRLGGGPAGRLGAGGLAHLVVEGELPVRGVSNPLPTRGGEPPESLERARLIGPRSFRGRRAAVTANDCAELAAAHPEVEAAAGRLHWTGSWQTVFVHLQRRGGRALDAELESDLRRRLEPRLLAGRDLELRDPVPVALDVVLEVEVAPGVLRESVERELVAALGDGEPAAGGRGFFHPDAWPLGRGLSLGELLDAAMAIAGVARVEPRRFRRVWAAAEAPAVVERIDVAPHEIVSARSRPDRPDLGALRLELRGGFS